MSYDYERIFTKKEVPGRAWWPNIPPEQQDWVTGLADFIAKEQGGIPPPWDEVILAFENEFPGAWIPSSTTMAKQVKKLLSERG